MAVSLKPANLRRYKDIATLLIKHGRSDLVRQAGLEAALADEQALSPEVHSEAEELAGDLEKLGPTFIKLGQLLSTRADLLPAPYLAALARLQDKVEPFPYEEVEQIVAEELGVKISKAFSSFASRPLAAASLGQVHAAALRDGRPVAVKVQRPGIRQRVAEDLEALEEIAGLIDRHTEAGRRYLFSNMLEEFKKSLIEELDYRREAAHLVTLGNNLTRFESIVVPRPIEDYTTSRVLTMEYIQGTQIGDLSPLVRTDLAGAELAEELFRAYLHQVLVDGLFHADPHPGNVFLTQDRRIALIDLGMVGRVRPALQEKLLKLLLAISDGDGDQAAALALAISQKREGYFDEPRFCRQIADLVAREHSATLEEIEVGSVVLELSRTAGENGVLVPPELTLLGKALLNLDLIGRKLDPEFDPNEAIRRSASDLLTRRMWKTASPSHLFSTLLEGKELAEKMPGRLNRILDLLADNRLRLKVDAIDEDQLMVGFQKVANRITVGLVLAALIVGAGLLMRVETSFTLFGYPGLAMLCFLLAAGGGFWLVWTILWNDRPVRKKPPGR